MLVAVLSPSIAGKKTGGVPIMGGKSTREHIPHTPAEKAELEKFLVDLGYVQYATPEFVTMMDALGYDSIEDLPNLAEEDDYEELGMPEKHAEKIQEAALKELLRRFLAAIPEGSTAACTKLERHRPDGRPPLRAPGRSPAYAYDRTPRSLTASAFCQPRSLTASAFCQPLLYYMQAWRSTWTVSSRFGDASIYR
jgi:hypothetical protein